MLGGKILGDDLMYKKFISLFIPHMPHMISALIY